MGFHHTRPSLTEFSTTVKLESDANRFSSDSTERYLSGGEEAVAQLGHLTEEFVGQIGGLGVQIAAEDAQVGAAGRVVDELRRVEGLRDAVRAVLVVAGVVLGVQLDGKSVPRRCFFFFLEGRFHPFHPSRFPCESFRWFSQQIFVVDTIFY